MNHVTKLIALFDGKVTKCAEKLGVTYQAIRKWERTGVPAERVLPIIRITHGQITPHELRPDIYPDPEWMPELDQEAA